MLDCVKWLLCSNSKILYNILNYQYLIYNSRSEPRSSNVFNVACKDQDFLILHMHSCSCGGGSIEVKWISIDFMFVTVSIWKFELSILDWFHLCCTKHRISLTPKHETKSLANYQLVWLRPAFTIICDNLQDNIFQSDFNYLC